MKTIVGNVFALFLISLTLFSVDSRVWSQEAGKPQASRDKADYPPVPEDLAQTVFRSVDGTSFRLSDYRGNVVLVNLWAIWLGPCREEMPKLQAMHERFADRGLRVIGLNVGELDGKQERTAVISSFADRMKITYILASAKEQSTDIFFRLSTVHALPQTLLIGREGGIRGIFVGGGPRVVQSMSETVEKVMNE